MKQLLLWGLLLILMGCAHTGPYVLHTQTQMSLAEQAQVTLPKAIDVVQLDGKKLKLAYSPDDVRHYYLLPGQHELVLRYVQLWEDDMGNEEVLTSKLVGFQLTTKAGDHFELVTDMPRTLEDARRFSRDIQLQLKGSGNALLTGQLIAAFRQPAAIDVLINDKGSPYEHLVEWWRVASPDEKEMFLKYIRENPF